MRQVSTSCNQPANRVFEILPFLHKSGLYKLCCCCWVCVLFFFFFYLVHIMVLDMKHEHIDLTCMNWFRGFVQRKINSNNIFSSPRTSDIHSNCVKNRYTFGQDFSLIWRKYTSKEPSDLKKKKEKKLAGWFQTGSRVVNICRLKCSTVEPFFQDMCGWGHQDHRPPLPIIKWI